MNRPTNGFDTRKRELLHPLRLPLFCRQEGELMSRE